MSNGIPIYEYRGDKRDNLIPLLTDYLLSFLDVDDVRAKIDEDFKIKKIIDKTQEIY